MAAKAQAESWRTGESLPMAEANEDANTDHRLPLAHSPTPAIFTLRSRACSTCPQASVWRPRPGARRVSKQRAQSSKSSSAMSGIMLPVPGAQRSVGVAERSRYHHGGRYFCPFGYLRECPKIHNMMLPATSTSQKHVAARAKFPWTQKGS